MILTRTPMRVSLLGGGSDFPSFYHENQGCVLATTIKKYIYISLLKKFDKNIRLGYSCTENVSTAKELKHDIARECLSLYEIDSQIEITSCSEAPCTGTGMGSSSSYCVGLLSALHQYKYNKQIDKEILAQQACMIELEKLQKPIGKQDQYIASYGGIRKILFNSDGTVESSIINMHNSTKNKLQDNLIIVYTGITRSADSILHEQNEKTKKDFKTKSVIQDMVGLAHICIADLENNKIESVGAYLHQAWNLKKKYTASISNEIIDEIYKTGINNGASGGKLLGAGGGGFILFFAYPDTHARIKEALQQYTILPIEFEEFGASTVYCS